MSLSHTLANTTNWRRFLLEDPPPDWLREGLPDFLKATGQQFLDATPAHIEPVAAAALDHWYQSAEGQDVLAKFTAALWDQMASLSAHAMPAHDARHAMFKVPAAALEYIHAGDVQGWARLGLLGALLHDYGRWAEERIWGYPGESLVHARLSFLLGRELLQQFDMPEAAGEQILLCAIRHTTGAVPDDPLPLKVTVTADRDQLYGPELVLRLFHHAVGPAGETSSFYGELPGVTVLDRLYAFLRTRLPGPLFTRQSHVNHLWSILATFILRCETFEASRKRFVTGEKPLERFGFGWRRAWEAAQADCPSGPALMESARAVLSAPNVAPSARFHEMALTKVQSAPVESKPALAAALAYIAEQRRTEDARQLRALKILRIDYQEDALVQTIASRLIAGWSPAEPCSR